VAKLSPAEELADLERKRKASEGRGGLKERIAAIDNRIAQLKRIIEAGEAV
jgi:hypothetical protein